MSLMVPSFRPFNRSSILNQSPFDPVHLFQRLVSETRIIHSETQCLRSLATEVFTSPVSTGVMYCMSAGLAMERDIVSMWVIP